MKKIIVSMTLMALTICLIIYSCRKESSSVKDDKLLSNAITALPKSDQTSRQGWSPEGTVFEQTKDGTILGTAPDGWHYIGYKAKGGIFDLTHGSTKSITCTCNVKGECIPFFAESPFGSKQGCFGDCSDCDMKQSIMSGTEKIAIASGGYYAPSAKTRLLKNGEQAAAVFDALIESDAYKAELASFTRIAHNGKPLQEAIIHEDGTFSAPIGYSLVGVSIMGRGTVMVLPDEYVKSVLGYIPFTKVTCSCSKTGTCKLKTKGVPGLNSRYCEGTCNGCTLTFDSKVSNPQGQGYEVAIQTYVF